MTKRNSAPQLEIVYLLPRIPRKHPNARRKSLIAKGGNQFSMHKYYLSNSFVGFAYGTQLHDPSCFHCRAGVCVRRVVGTSNHVCQVEHNAANQLN